MLQKVILCILLLGAFTFTLFQVFFLHHQALPVLWEEEEPQLWEQEPSQQHNKTNASLTTSLRPVIDFLSVGSLSRLDFMQAQRETFASKLRIRHFFNITELVDQEVNCSSQLSNDDVFSISDWCRSWKRKDENASLLKYHFTNGFGRVEWLQKKKNPAGWLCAQKRPVFGMIHALRQYQQAAADTVTAFPDYLIVGDDDTYYNLDTFVKFFPANASHNPTVTAGCMVRAPVHIINWTFPFGGYGTTYSRGSLQRFLEPITCGPHDHIPAGACRQIQKNWFGEANLFKSGDSLLDLMEKMVKSQKYIDYKNWKHGYCFHSDWFLSYFVNWYNVSNHDDALRYYDNVAQNRLHMYQDSEAYGTRRPKGLCAFSGDACPLNATVCHYATPSLMHAMNDGEIQKQPKRL